MLCAANKVHTSAENIPWIPFNVYMQFISSIGVNPNLIRDITFLSDRKLRNYLGSTKDKRLHFSFGAQTTGPNLILNAFSDSDYSSGPDRRSTLAYVIALQQVPIAWSSQRQRCVAHSTAEVEYVALSNAIRMCKYFMHLAEFFAISHQCAVFCDNNAAVASMLSPTVSSKLRHIDTAIHSARDFFSTTDVTLQYVPSEKNVADLFTKTLDLQRVNNPTQIFLK